MQSGLKTSIADCPPISVDTYSLIYRCYIKTCYHTIDDDK